ncbi:MAG: hypothetical protein GF317_24270 [Candidatus Lokiarchaeota archaeon]|nr:hypothetical protein [Candidatus Lokiarchaeota archaeon]MBD3202490.1 hypothetical protein [Candidatus Lokiarchaeota archaeon]
MINLEVKIPDTPGTLIELIKPISNNGGNIFGILHHHDKKINNLIPVDLTFELPEELREKALESIKSELRKENIQIDRISLGTEKRHLTILLTGHVFDTDVVDTIKRLAKKKIIVTGLEARFTEVDDISTVKFSLELPESISEKNLINEMNKICEEKNLMMIRV